MSSLNMDLGVLEHQMHQAHRNAVQAELSAAGLQEVGHPLLLCILRSAGERCPDGQAQRELAELLNISPPAVAASLKSLEKKGYIHREPEPGDAGGTGCRLTRQGGEGGGRLLRLPAAGDPQNVHGFTTEEQAVMRGFYLRMLENLQAPLAGVRASHLA